MVFVVKLQCNNDIRRVTVNEQLTFKGLTDLAKSLFGSSLNGAVTFKYKDDEGDQVTITSDRELEEAFRLVNEQQILRITIFPAETKPEKCCKGKSSCSSQEEVPFFDLLEKLVLNNPFIRDLINNIEVEVKSVPSDCEGWKNLFGQSGVVHNAMCDSCNVQIRGNRFKCLNCPNYDLCESCTRKEGVHAPDHKFQKITQPQRGCPWKREYGNVPQSEVPHNATCDQCNSAIKGIRYKCKTCPDYDLCETCMNKGGVHVTGPDHTFEPITRPTCPYMRRCGNRKQNDNVPQSEIVHPADCDGCQTRIKGLRYKCSTCPDYDLCESCMNKKVHSEHTFTTLSKPSFCPIRVTRNEDLTSMEPKETKPQVTPVEKKMTPVVTPVVTPKPTPSPSPVVEKKTPEPVIVPIQTPTFVPVPIATPVPVPVTVTPVPKPTPTPSPVVEKKVPEPQKKEEAKPSPFETKLKQLEEMGFLNRPHNIELLVKYHGDMVQTVKVLLE